VVLVLLPCQRAVERSTVIQAVIEEPVVAKPKGKQKGALIRVSEEFAEYIKKVAGFDGMSIAEYADRHFMPYAERHYREAVLREAKQMEGKVKR
jgi:hypothetical protein